MGGPNGASLFTACGHYCSEPVLRAMETKGQVEGMGSRKSIPIIPPHLVTAFSVTPCHPPGSMSVSTCTLETLLLATGGTKCQNLSLGVALPLSCFPSWDGCTVSECPWANCGIDHGSHLPHCPLACLSLVYPIIIQGKFSLDRNLPQSFSIT